ncbi:MAG: hypothetical protein A4E52_02207 [Pelotomaculum sp. PtaB.Bin013]|uniref:DUF2461 family protein n=1 Tax=Pelotomaculum isophthalicicum TaxID=342448 RepID=UPI0009D1D00F|nr:MAG: hypothetical protein A4E52_02207 [Pelotomaculum sp. PtaB.Bin013]
MGEVSFLYKYKQQTFVVEGDKYKKPLGNIESEELLEWYQRKNLYLVCNKMIDENFLKSNLLDELISGYSLITSFYHYLWKIKNMQQI